MDSQNVPRQQPQMEAPIAVRFLRLDHKNHIVLDAFVALAPDRNGIFRNIHATVEDHGIRHGTLGEIGALQFGGEVATGVTYNNETFGN